MTNLRIPVENFIFMEFKKQILLKFNGVPNVFYLTIVKVCHQQSFPLYGMHIMIY